MSVARRQRLGALGLFVAVTLAGPAAALSFQFPAPATLAVSRSLPLASYALPLGPWHDGEMPNRIVEGARTDAAWRLEAPGLTTLELLAPLRAQLLEAGYTILWECETEACGGFDFRFAIEVLDEPDMHVDLADFRFLAAEREGGDGPDTVVVLVSRSSAAGFVQVTSVGTPVDIAAMEPGPEVGAQPPAPADAVEADEGFAARLERSGSVPLDDLIFESGSAKLGEGRFASLDALAAYLRANPGRTVALVGHTDASGALAGNVALSTARAASVRARLTGDYGIPRAQVLAEGVGYLAPRATNLTPEGRARNRRVEVMITSTQ